MSGKEHGGGQVDGGGGGADPAAAAVDDAAAELCANCNHSKRHHPATTKEWNGCNFAIAVTWCDGPVGCDCERFVSPGTPCSVEGCDRDAVHYRKGADNMAYDMCVEHYEQAEPYCDRYFELTGGRGPCVVDGCGKEGARFHFDRNNDSHSMCKEHWDQNTSPYTPPQRSNGGGGAAAASSGQAGCGNGGGGREGGRGRGGDAS